MTGAIDFLRKAKAICLNRTSCGKCPLVNACNGFENITDEADIVRKVMDYRLEDGDERSN